MRKAERRDSWIVNRGLRFDPYAPRLPGPLRRCRSTTHDPRRPFLGTSMQISIHAFQSARRRQTRRRQAAGRAAGSCRAISSRGAPTAWPSSTISRRFAPRAAAIRDRALDNLDVYLEEFERNATARGAIVHWAETRRRREPHRVRHRARNYGVKKAVKSKSMVTRGVRAQRRARGRRRRGRRDRSRRIHPAARARSRRRTSSRR